MFSLIFVSVGVLTLILSRQSPCMWVLIASVVWLQGYFNCFLICLVSSSRHLHQIEMSLSPLRLLINTASFSILIEFQCRSICIIYSAWNKYFASAEHRVQQSALRAGHLQFVLVFCIWYNSAWNNRRSSVTVRRNFTCDRQDSFSAGHNDRQVFKFQ